MTDNIVMIKNTPVAGRRPTGGRQGELYFNFADRVIGCMDGAGMPVDIASAIPVGETEPANAVPGMLWLDTGSAPATLLVFMGTGLPEPWIPVTASFVIATEEQALEGENNDVGMTPLRVRQAIEAMSSSVSVGDTAPADPRPGELWFKTAAPVGLFIWYQDADSSQWVQVGGGGGSEFASIAEARAGAITDKVMSPALVQARSGVQNLQVANLTALTFDQVPANITEFVIGFFDLECPANVSFSFDFAGDPAARVWANRTWLVAGSPIGSVNVNQWTVYPVGHETGVANFIGDIVGIFSGSNLWSLHSHLRDGYGSRQQHTIGTFKVTDGVIRFPRLTFSAAPTRGAAFCRWRI